MPFTRVFLSLRIKNEKIIFALAIVLPTIGLVGCDRVEPGNVGIKVNKLGDDKGVGEVVGVGRYWTGWNTEVYIFPTFKQMKTYDEPFSFQMSDGTTIGYHIGVAYKVDPSKVTTVFQTYRKGVDDITDTDLRQKIADALNRLASKMTTDKFIDGGKSELLDSALKDIQAEMTPIGIQVMSLSYVGKPEYPPTVIDSINAKVTANQKTLQREQEVKQREAKPTCCARKQPDRLTPFAQKPRPKPMLFVYAVKLCARTPVLWSWKPSINGTAHCRNT